VKILKVVQTVAKVAETVLTVYAVGVGVVRWAAGRAVAANAAAGAGGRGATVVKAPPPAANVPGAQYPTNYPGQMAYDDTINAANQTLNTTGAGGGMISRQRLAEAQVHAQYVKELQAEMAKRTPWSGLPSDKTSLQEFMAIMDKLDKKYGGMW
jgi:hypothetical protein